MNSENYNDVIVSKPWGHEYLCYSNETVAIWLLNININLVPRCTVTQTKILDLLC